MADKKISQLTSATTPLAGTEVLPIVQSSTTVQVSAANVTAGRAVSGASFDVTGSTAPANGMYLPAANSVALSTNSSVRFRVDASGNAGLGVTPAAHGSSERALDIGNTTSFGRQSDAALVANFNTFLNASSQYVYRISSFASSYQQLAGEHKFFTAPSGTAGNNVTLTQQMTITQAGNITANTGNFVIGTAGKGITTGSAIPLGFGVNNTVTAMTIDASSNVGVGTASPASKFNVVGDQIIIGSADGTGVLGIQIKGTSIGAIPAAQVQGYIATGNSTIGVAGDLLIACRTDVAAGVRIITGTTPTERVIVNGSGNVGIGTSAPAATAILDVQSTTKGVRFPNMTTTQKNAITPSAGTVIFDTTLAKLCVYSGSAWQTVTSI